MATTGTSQNAMQRLGGVFQNMSLGQRLSLGTLVIFLGIAGFYVVSIGSAEDYAVAFSGLEEKDAARITTMLTEHNVPYELAAGGGTIRVPMSKQHEVRLMAAGEGLTGGGIGFEVFDQPSFWSTPSEMKIKYRRALAGELRRTINSLEEVQESRVHIVLGKKATFREDDQDATASVTLTTKRGRKLNSGQVQGIVNLVASSVEGLEPERVTVVDQKGKVLSAPSDPMMAGSLPAMEMRRTMEKEYERRLLDLLETTVGVGNVRVRVNADVDFRRVERVNERHDQGAVLEESTRTSSEASLDEKAQGVPGAQANVAGAQGAAVEAQKTGTQSSMTDKKFKPNTTVERVNEAGEEIKRLNIAVMINGTYDGEGDARKYQPRAQEEMAIFEKIVKGAVGFDEGRGDVVVVTNMPFKPLDEAPVVEPAAFVLSPDVWRAVRYGMTALLALLLLVFLVRPLVKTITGIDRGPVVAEAAGAADEAEEDEQDAVDVSVPEVQPESFEDLAASMRTTPRSLAVEFAGEQPRKTAQILRVWLLEDAGEGATLPSAAEAQDASQVKESVKQRAAS